MYLIAESGSTKCDWMLVDQQGNYMDLYKTIGFNPFFHNKEFICNELNKEKGLIHVAPKVTRVYFYGAGCSSDHYTGIVKSALTIIFPNAEIVVDHDMLSAAFSTYDGVPCITSIIGTGSNSCYFDGAVVTEEVPALGYILGDEGSGSYFGKKLLTAFLYKKLPAVIATDLVKEFNISKAMIFENVYEKPNANVYLASFTRFIGRYKEELFVKDMLIQGMRDFLVNHVCCFENYKELPVHFIGSVAFHFQDELAIAAKELDVKIGRIIKQPIKNLVDYHIQYIFPKVS